MAITAGVIGYACKFTLAALLTRLRAFRMAAQSRRPAGLDRLHQLELMQR